MGSDGSIIIDTELDSSGFKKGAAELQRKMNNLVAAANKIGEIPFNSARFSTQVSKTKDSIAQLQAKLDELGSKTVSTVGYETTLQSISKAEQALEKLIGKQKLYDQMGISENSAQWRRLEMQIIDAEEKLARFNAQKDAMEANGTAFVFGTETEQYHQLSVSLQQATEQLQQFEQAKEKASKVSAFTAGLKKMIQGIGKYISHSKKSHSATSGLLKGLTSLKTMLFSRVKRMFISYIFNEMKEAMTALQQFDKSFGAAMKNMKSSAKGLSANLAVSFSGLISAIEPVLTRIINVISTAISYLNTFFSMLSGKSTVTVAKKQMDDYAKSAGGAGKAVDALKRKLYNFDEINKIDSSDSGGGGGGANMADLFEEIPIDSFLPDSIMDFFERIKAAFEAGDWESIGSIIAEGLNSGMGAVDGWITGTLQPLADLWSGRIAHLFNGLIRGINWYTMGKTLADGLNTVFKSIDTFLSTFDFAATGRAVANLVKGCFSNIDWASLTHGLSSGVKGVFDGMTAFIQTIDLRAVPGDIGSALLDAITAVDWTGIAESFAGSLGSSIGSVFAFRSGIYEAIENGIADLIEWVKSLFSENGPVIIDGLKQGILDGLKGIGSWIKENIIYPFIAGILNAFGLKTSSSELEKIGGDLANEITTAFKNTDWTSLGSNVLSGIGNGINSGWGWLSSRVSNLASSMLRTAENALGIRSPSRVFRDEVGKFVGLGLAEGIEDSERNVNRSVSALAKSTVSGFGNPSLAIDVAGAEMVSGLDSVASRLSSIVDSFRAITGMLNSVGGLTVPEIATGTVVPPRIKAAAYEAEVSERYRRSSASDSGVVEVLRQLADEIIRAIEEKDTTLRIDGEEIGRTATRFMRANARSTGGVY